MNINPKTRDEVIRQQKEACQLRVTTGKKPKLTPEERGARKREAIDKKMKYERKNMGDFVKIYPTDQEEDPYCKYLEFAEEMFQQSMGGTRKVKKPEKQEEVKPPLPTTKQKRPTPGSFSTTPDLYRKPIAERKVEAKTTTHIKGDQKER